MLKESIDIGIKTSPILTNENIRMNYFIYPSVVMKTKR